MAVTLEEIKKRYPVGTYIECPIYREWVIVSNDIYVDHEGDFWFQNKGGIYYLTDDGCRVFAEIIKDTRTNYSDLIQSLATLEGKVIITGEKIGNRIVYTIEDVISLEERYKNQLQGKSFLDSKNVLYFFSPVIKHGNAKIFWDNGESQHDLEFIFERIESGEWVIQKD